MTGLEDDILGAYCFLCNNFNFASRKDEIILVGYSRGAFTVRCLANFISCVGLLRRKNLPFLYSLFNEWAQAGNAGETAILRKKIEKIPEFSHCINVEIKVLAEWDTVSSMRSTKFSFVQDTVPDRVCHAFFALSLHEKRLNFQPIPWKQATKKTKTVEQCAFLGCHGDVGGGNLDAGLSTVTLLWMVAKIRAVCDAVFDEEALLQTMLPHASPCAEPDVSSVDEASTSGKQSVQNPPTKV